MNWKKPLAGNHSTVIIYPVLLLVFSGLTACTHCVKFDSLTGGTRYGNSTGYSPGDPLFRENDIDVSIHELPWVGGGNGFNFATVESAPGGFGSGNVMSTNNVTLEFNISDLPFNPKRATFDFRDLGGSEHLEVDRCGPRYTGEIQASAGTTLCGGVAITSISTSPVPGGVVARGELKGSIQKNFRIGGQEFKLDNVCFYRD